jgi:hypothetical protein
MDRVIDEEADDGFVSGTHARAAAIADIDQLKRRQASKPLPRDGAGHAGAGGEFCFARQRRSYGEAVSPDVFRNLRHDAVYEARRWRSRTVLL